MLAEQGANPCDLPEDAGGLIERCMSSGFSSCASASSRWAYTSFASLLCNTHATRGQAILPLILEEMACFLASQGTVTPGLEKNAVRYGVLTARFSRLTGSPAICPLAQP
jgi:hypothetical protein